MPSKKHPLPDDSTSSTNKSHKSDQPHIQTFQSNQPSTGGTSSISAASARNKVTGAPSRTGQACDRCKSRKIRCDDTAGGCLPCRQNNTECKTTDRITHRATVRGHTETLERDVAFLKQQIGELEQQLRDVGVEPKVSTPYTPARTAFGAQWTNTPTGQASTWDQSGTPGDATWNASRRASTVDEESNNFPLSAPRTGMHGDEYLGVSPANDLSNTRGTVLSLFGMEIDLADFISTNPNDKIAALMTYAGSTATIMGRDTFADMIASVELPKTFENCVQYSGFYFTVVNSTLPLLHKPAFDELLDKIYYRSYEPSVSEKVIVHMVVAFIQFQMALRNDRNSSEHVQTLTESLCRFHFCLTHYSELLRSRTIQDMQAAALICIYVRNFPNPGPAWSLINATLTVCIELGYHRSVRAFAAGAFYKDLLNTELRKRIFWTLLMCNVVMSGKLGRPMPIRCEDYDVEFPEPLNDDLVKVELGAGSGQCNFLIAIEYFKMTELFLETYSGIYSVRPPHNYEDTVRKLENKAKRWKSKLPAALAEREPSDVEPSMSRTMTLWMICWECEFQVLLHHPALCRSTSPEVISRHIDICMRFASKYIDTTVQLWTLKSLDTTWYNITTFFAAIFTLLFAMWQRRDQITAEELRKLETDRDVCLDVIRDIGDMLGSGERLKDKMDTIINTSIERIRQAYDEKNASASASASAAVASAALRHSLTRSPSQVQDSSREERIYSTGFPEPYQAQKPDQQQQSGQPRSSTYPPPTDPALTQPQHPYPAVPSRHYPSPAAPGPVPNYPYNPYSPESNAYNVNMNLHSHTPMQPDAYMYNSNPSHGYQQQQQQHQQAQPHNAQQQQPPYESQVAWREWFASTRGNHDPASALMALGGREVNQGATSPHGHGQALPYAGTIGASGMPQLLPNVHANTAIATQEWPMSAYDPSANRNYLVMNDGTMQAKSD